jgi:hypothetical protein
MSELDVPCQIDGESSYVPMEIAERTILYLCVLARQKKMA